MLLRRFRPVVVAELNSVCLSRDHRTPNDVLRLRMRSRVPLQAYRRWRYRHTSNGGRPRPAIRYRLNHLVTFRNPAAALSGFRLDQPVPPYVPQRPCFQELASRFVGETGKVQYLLYPSAPALVSVAPWGMIWGARAWRAKNPPVPFPLPMGAWHFGSWRGIRTFLLVATA